MSFPTFKKLYHHYVVVHQESFSRGNSHGIEFPCDSTDAEFEAFLVSLDDRKE
jgi:hypothetical protein